MAKSVTKGQHTPLYVLCLSNTMAKSMKKGQQHQHNGRVSDKRSTGTPLYVLCLCNTMAKSMKKGQRQHNGRVSDKRSTGTPLYVLCLSTQWPSQ